MIAPFRRAALAQRAEQDREEELRASELEDPGERADLSLELSELAREAAESLGADWIANPPDDLDQKARLYAVPLAMLRRR